MHFIIMINIYKSKAVKKFLKDNVYNPDYSIHGIAVNKHVLVSGKTGSGKSNFVINYIRVMADVFSHVYLFTKDPDEPLYNLLQDQLKKSITIANVAVVPDVKELKNHGGESLVIFDDFISENKKTLLQLEQFAILSRKHNMTCLFLTQSFYAVAPKLRNQCAYIVLLNNANKRELSSIISTLSLPIANDTIKKIIKNATKEELNVCFIDALNRDPNRVFRRNFDDFYEIVDEDNNELPYIHMYEGSGIIN